MADTLQSQPLANATRQTETLAISSPPLTPDIPSFTWGGYWHGIGVMFLLLGILWFLLRIVKRYGRFNFMPRQGSLDKDAFFMESQMPIGRSKCLMVVRFLNKRMLLGVTEQNITVLANERIHEEADESDFEAYMDLSSKAKTEQDKGTDTV